MTTTSNAEKKNAKYWRDRSVDRLVSSEQLAEFAIVDVQSIYSQAQKNIEKQIESIYANYSEKGILNVSELKKAIGTAGKNEFLRNIQRQAKILGIDPSKIYDERYLSRLTRLEALLEQTKLEVMSIAPQEESATGQTYERIIKQGYQEMQKDLSRLGITPAFATADQLAVDTIMRAKWYGGNYSSRIWNNTGKLAEQLPTILGGGLLSGESKEKTLRKLRDKFDVSTYEARRLVVTETNFFHGQSELQSYIDDGILMYELHATLDDRTSKICRRMNRRVFYVADAIVGVNYHPFHGHCRTTSVAYFGERIPDTGLSDRQRARYIGDNQATTKRFQRFSDFDNEEIKTRWKKAMQKQMNPEKTGQTHDYNADMNLLTQAKRNKEITPEEYQKSLNQLMASIPEDYALKDALENVAKLEGWEKPVQKQYSETVKKLVEDINLTTKDVNFDDIQQRFLEKSKIKFENVRTNSDDIGGMYNPQTNKLQIDGANLKQFSKDFDIPDYPNRVIQHELGHAVDAFAPQLRADVATFSESSEFTKLIMRKGGNTEGALKISQSRLADSILDSEFSDSVRNMNPVVYEGAYKTGERMYRGDTSFQIPIEAAKYHLQPDELFAESYSMYHTQPKYLKKIAPDIYDYMEEISKKKL